MNPKRLADIFFCYELIKYNFEHDLDTVQSKYKNLNKFQYFL